MYILSNCKNNAERIFPQFIFDLNPLPLIPVVFIRLEPVYVRFAFKNII